MGVIQTFVLWIMPFLLTIMYFYTGFHQLNDIYTMEQNVVHAAALAGAYQTTPLVTFDNNGDSTITYPIDQTAATDAIDQVMQSNLSEQSGYNNNTYLNQKITINFPSLYSVQVIYSFDYNPTMAFEAVKIFYGVSTGSISAIPITLEATATMAQND